MYALPDGDILTKYTIFWLLYIYFNEVLSQPSKFITGSRK